MNKYERSYDILELAIDHSDYGNRKQQRKALKNYRELMKEKIKLDKIKKVIDKIFKDYTLENGKMVFCGNDLLEIQQILKEEM